MIKLCPSFFSLFKAKLVIAALLIGLPAAAHAEKHDSLLIMPPKYDYQTICKVSADRLKPEEIEKLRQRSLAELPPDALIRLAEAYSEKDDVIAPDYAFALQAIEQVVKLPYRGDNRPFIDEALFLKHDIIQKGKAGPASKEEAKAVLDMLLARNHDKAHRRYGELYEAEERYPEAAESYKKSIIGGNIAAYVKLARLYYQQKLDASPEEFKNALSNLNSAIAQSIAKGRCEPMLELARFYDMLGSIEGAKAYSLAWYKQAAAIPLASFKLAYADKLMQAKSDGHTEQVLALWKEAALLGSSTAMRNLGDYYLSDKGFDPLQAGHWLEQASQRKDTKISTLMQWAESLKYWEPTPYPKIISIYERAAAQGHVEAWLRLGRLYQYDIVAADHLTKALEYYQKAAAGKSAPAMRMLQTAYSCNIGAGFNEKQAEYWQKQYEASDEALVAAFFTPEEKAFERTDSAVTKRLQSLAEEGHVKARAILAVHQLVQGNLKPGQQQIEALLRQDIESDNGHAGHYAVGVLLYSIPQLSERKQEGLRLLSRAADAGNAAALNMLGDVHAARKDYQQAIDYYQRAAKNPGEKDQAYRKLYHIYADTEAIPQAVHSLEQLAANDDAGAMMRLAQHYYVDLKDAVRAQHWFNQVVSHYPCDAALIQQIAISYRNGINGAPTDMKKAEQWANYLQQIPLRGNRNPVLLARILLYQDEIGGTPSADRKSEALTYLTRLADAGNADAGQTLLNYYLLQSNAQEAVRLLNEQADRGSVISMFYLSNLYLAGFGDIPPDKEKAVYWLEEAKARDSDAAATRLSLLQK